jgi:carboxyl-terminal processing protease
VLKQFPNGALYGLGITTSATSGPSFLPEARAPLFVTEVLPGSPAERQQVALGDIITTVNGSAPFTNDQLNPGVMAWLSPQPSDNAVVHVTLLRPSTGRNWAVDLTPTFFAPPPSSSVVSARVLSDSLAYVKLTQFTPDAANLVLGAIANLHLGDRLRGIILDLRDNHGGSPDAVSQLLGAFVHGKTLGYLVDGGSKRTVLSTTDAVALLHQRVVLTNRGCASACEELAGAVKDLGIGPLVGTRTAGAIAGVASGYALNDGSALGITALFGLGAKGEKLDGTGVAPDYLLPLTAQDLSAGHDPDIEKAMSLLR